MENHFYHELIEPYIKGLSNLDSLIVKGERHARVSKFDVSNILNYRLAPDMHNFITQVQYVCFTALESVEALTGKKAPSLPYDEKDVKDLRMSIKKTLDYVRKIRPEHFEGAEGKYVESFLLSNEEIGSRAYIHLAALPNFYFHLTTAYNILRHNGVLIGKDDYLGKLPARPIKKKK